MVIFFLSLKAHYGQVFDPSNKSFEFLSLSWCGHPKNVGYDTHLSYRGSVALKGPRVVPSDRKHDFQQIEVFEKKIFEYLREKFQLEPKIWYRWSDQCAAQCKSQYVVEKLRTSAESMGFCKDCQVNFCYFEVGEGKNESDSLGSLIKLAYCRALHRNRDKAARNVPEIAQLIRENLA